MAKAKRLSTHKAQKAPKTKLTKVHKHGNITKRLHGRKRAADVKHHAKAVAWEPGVHKPHRHGVERHIAGHRTTRHPGTHGHAGPHHHHAAGTHPKVAGHHRTKHGRKVHPSLTGRHRKPLTAAQRAHLSAALKGKHHVHHGHVVHHVAGHHKLSAAAKAKIAAKLRGRHHKGRPMSAAARAKLSAHLKGKHHAGHKGVHHKGHRLSAASRSRIAARMRGHKHPHRGFHGHRTGHHGTRHKRRW